MVEDKQAKKYTIKFNMEYTTFITRVFWMLLKVTLEPHPILPLTLRKIWKDYLRKRVT